MKKMFSDAQLEEARNDNQNLNSYIYDAEDRAFENLNGSWTYKGHQGLSYLFLVVFQLTY
jgi:hypothetical protein